MKLLNSRNNGRQRRLQPHLSGTRRNQCGHPAAELGNTPVLFKLALSKSHAALTPFSRKRTLVVLHFLTNLRAFMRAMLLHGLDPALTTVFFKPYEYPEKAQVIAWLRKRGFEVRAVTSITAGYLAELEEEVVMTGLPIFVVEDGSYFATAMHQWCPTLLARTIGTVEQTSHGIAKLLEAVGKDHSKVAIPVVSVPDSTLKKDFEPPFVADGILLALTNLISRPMRQLKVLVLGYGVIGKALVARLVDAGADVTVYDPKLKHDPSSLYARFTAVRDPVAAAADQNLIVGATGDQSVTPEVIDAASGGTYFASASSEQREIAIDYLEEIAISAEVLRHGYFHCKGGRERVSKGTTYRVLPDCREFYLLHDGQPLNFMGMGGMADREADLVLSLIFAGALELALGTYAGERGILRDAVNQLDTKYRIAETFVRFHREARQIVEEAK